LWFFNAVLGVKTLEIVYFSGVKGILANGNLECF
jgi:hypothetical protein